MADTTSDRERQTWARIAGLFYLIMMATSMVGELVPATIRGSGDIGAVAARVLASEPLYRSGLVSMLFAALSIVVLAHALYVVVEPVNRRLAQLALWARLGEAFIIGATLVVQFATIRVYAEVGDSAVAAGQLEVLRSFAASAYGAGFLVWMAFYSLGSTLMFYLLYVSRLIPRALAGLGVLGSALQGPMSLGSLIFPEYAEALQYLWGPIAVAEIGTGFWLLLAGIRLPDASPGQRGAIQEEPS